MYHWHAFLLAPNESLYEGFKFELDIQYPITIRYHQ